ncbi:MAG: glycogen synthase GlgA [Candidatus Omnitrophota bacterium]
MKILFCSAEVAPFAQTGGLGEVCGALPLALEKRGIDVSIILPRYRCVDVKRFAIERLNKDISTATIGKNIKVYFIENDALYDRDGIYGDKWGDYVDNLDRFSYFCKASLNAAKQLNLRPDVIHCHDWQAALIPVYLKSIYANDAFYKKTKSILTIHNLAYQGIFDKEEFDSLELNEKLFSIEGFEFYDYINLLKGGILFSDLVTTVSQQYAKEIQTDEFGCGLNGVLGSRPFPVTGILNGIDYDAWNPQTDSLIAKRYSAATWEDKYANKSKVQQEFKLKVDRNIPLFGFVGRLSAQKGIDLLYRSIDAIAKFDLQIVFLGVGEEKYYKMLEKMSEKYPRKISSVLKFDETLSHKIYAGADIFLMPSVYEPCGLSQMISLKYGTIPLVFKAGGLAETIIPFDPVSGQGNGFAFERYEKVDLVKTVKLAVDTYRQADVFKRLVRKAFDYDFSWGKSAAEYEKIYKQCSSSV